MPRLLLASGLLALAFAASPTPAADPPGDPFAEGAVWAGDFRLAVKDASAQKWLLTVTERKGPAFKGEILIKSAADQVKTVKVEGTAPVKGGGAVAFKSEKQGFGQVVMRGKLADGVVALVFSGTTELGRPGAGTAVLKPKN